MKNDNLTQYIRSRCSISIGIVFAALVLLYGYYVKVQNANLFFESQFLHYPFLRDLVAKQFLARDFFTVFGEHLFPGYNLILAVNYYLFRIWGGFDSIVYAVFLILTAGIIVVRIFITSSLSVVNKGISCSLIALLLLSPTNNPQWGMALASAVGVIFIVLSALFIEEAFLGSHKKLNPFIFLLLPIGLILFLGGYAIGGIVALEALILVHVIKEHKLTSIAVVVTETIIVSLVIYLLLITHYSCLMAGRPTAIALNIGSIIKFGFLMTGASVFGCAFYEFFCVLWPYYVLGSILVGLTLCTWVDFIRYFNKGRVVMLALSVYSATNIAVISFFRYRNGLDGALGQWYNVHTHFIAVAVIYYLFLKFQEGVVLRKILCLLGCSIILISACIGYSCDWKKAPYARAYREKFIAQAPFILVLPETIQNKKDTTQTMLWDYETVKKTLDLMEANKLWIFNVSAPVVLETNSSKQDNPIIVICPLGLHDLEFHIYPLREWSKSIVKLNSNKKIQ